MDVLGALYTPPILFHSGLGREPSLQWVLSRLSAPTFGAGFGAPAKFEK